MLFGLSRPWTIAVLTVVVSFLVFAGVERNRIRHDAGWRYVAEVVTGNWSPDQPEPASGAGISDAVYIIGLLGATVLNYGPYVVLFAIFKSLLEGKKVMNLMMAMAVRDQITKSALLELLSTSMDLEHAEKLIASAYETTNETWEGRLEGIIGDKGLSEVMKEMRAHKYPEARTD